ncbi:MAG: hypothetical protein AAGB00_01365 [Planctomycetota bacterium]
MVSVAVFTQKSRKHANIWRNRLTPAISILDDARLQSQSPTAGSGSASCVIAMLRRGRRRVSAAARQDAGVQHEANVAQMQEELAVVPRLTPSSFSCAVVGSVGRVIGFAASRISHCDHRLPLHATAPQLATWVVVSRTPIQATSRPIPL